MTIKEKIADLTFYNLIAKLKDILTNVNDKLSKLQAGSSVISEAPVDGLQYARQDASWKEVQTSVGDLQLVLNEGNTANSTLILDALNGYSTSLDVDNITLFNQFGSNNRYLNLQPHSIEAENNLGNRISLTFERNSSGTGRFSFPDKVDGSYTLATESVITGTFANPTSITVTNGIITAIS